MTHHQEKRRESLRRTRNFVAGLLIGTSFVTPVFAAVDVNLNNEWTTLLLIGSIILLGTGLLLRIRFHSKAAEPPRVPQAQDVHDSIGQYRPNVFRP
jgi:cytochrome c biogenesis protein CcdA